MNIDRSKHNKYTTGAIYGNLTTGGIATDEGGNVTGTGLLYSGNVIYIGGSGGGGSIDPELLSQMLNQDAYSYLNIGDGVYTVNAEARQLKDNINLNIVGDNETTETQVSKDKYLNRTLYDASGLKGGRYSVTYKKVLVIETVNGESIEVPKWVITIEKISGTPIFTNTDFDGIQILNKDEEVVVYSVNSSKVTVNSSDTTGLISIVIYNDTQIDFTELRIVKSGDYIQDGTYNNIAIIKEIIIQEYITVAITQAGATRFWKLDELGKLYTTYDTYTTKTLGAYGKIWTDYGYTVGNYVQGISGGAFYIVDQLLNTYLEVDKLKVRKKAYFETLEIINVNSVGGKQIISPAGAITLNKVEDKGTYYRCYFLGLQDGVEIENRFKKDDLAFSLNFNIKTPGEYELVANHYFWRKVNAVSSAADANGNHWIDLDKIDCDVDSDIPHVNDVVAQLGNKTDTDRLSAMIFSSVDAESPRIVLCHGINSYSLSSKEYFDLGVNHLTNQAYMNVYGNSFVGARDGSTYVKYTLSEGLTIKGHISASSTYGGQSFSDVFVTTEVLSDSVKAIIGDDLEYLLNQIDGNIESYFYEYSPTLTNYPANTWDTEGDRLRHNGDTFTNIQKYVDDATTPDAGKSWRWVKNASNVWGWVAISDSDAVLALKKAGLALDTADGKRRVFVKKPETTDVYDIGDLWVNATYTDTVGMLVYSNDLLRAKKAKVKGIAFNITDWELASKYTDDTLADQAKQDAATALAAANNAAAEALAAKTRLNSWAEDGTISPTEKLALKAEIVRIDADKSDITGSYTKYGLGTPTSFNTAHANYRAALVDLTKALPENIVIPADFATKLNTYYSERTSALQAVAAKTKLLVDNALSAAEAAQAAATAAGTAANNAQTTINDYKDTIDDIFQDGIITASEKNRLNSLKDTVNTTLFDVLTTYSKVYNNTNLDGKILKTRLKTAYDAFSAAATALLNAVTTILNKVNTLSYAITKGDIATIDNAYINFNTKYTDYVGALGDANLEITNVISNTAYSNAVNKYAWLNGLFDPSQTTTIDGGVVTTGVLALGKTTSGVFKVNAGINGVSNTAYNGGGPAIWFGGDMLDKDNYSAGNRPANVATSMFRFDGSGYLGYKPNADPLKDLAPIWWDTTGNIHANPLSFFVGEETVGLLLASFLAVDSTGDGKVDYVILKAPFTYVLIGNGYIGYDAATNSVYVYVLDSSGNKQICNFYAYGEITAYGESSGGSAPSGALYLDELKDVLFTSLKATQLIQYNGSKWVNIDTSSIIASPTWANITGKPTTVAGYGITDAVVTSDVIKTDEIKTPTDSNIFSALRSLTEFISKNEDSDVSAVVNYLQGLKIDGKQLSRLISENEDAGELLDTDVMSALRVISEIEGYSEDLKKMFLRKDQEDTAQGFIEFLKGISVEEIATLTQGLEVGDFTTGALGSGAAVKMVDGTSYAEVDNLTVRQKATFRELIIEALKHIGGQLVLTPARMKCIRVVDVGSFYKCYFDTGDGEVTNEFVAGDLARCQVFTGNGTKYYWRLVTLVGEDWINLSKTSAAVGSDVPEAGDDIVQLGNATDPTRQNAQILSTVGVDAPSWKQYKGINSFSLEGKDTTVFSGIGNKISGETITTSGGSNLDDHLAGVAQDIQDALNAAQDAEDKAQQAIEDAEANVVTINREVGKLLAQLDGEVSNWFYAYSPTLADYPASDWDTNEIKDRHIGDTFTNTAQAPATDAGKSWRFVKNGSTYSWTQIADSDAVKALLEASKAQATADGKSTTHLFQPSKYKLGDMWVLNADQTVNGTAYKQGDVLSATQDSESFVQAHWLKRIRYTDDTKANQALDSLTNFTDTVFPQEKSQLQTQIDGKIETHFTATDPATAWTTADLKTKHTGDLWYNATTKKLNRYSGSGWNLVEDQKAIDAFNTASTAKDTADGKRRVFTTTPTTPYDVGDLWAQGTSGDLMRCATAKTSAQSYNVADWVKASKYTDDTVAEKKSATFFAKPSVYQIGDTWYLTKDETVNGIFYRKGTMLHAAYATGQESDWRQVIYEPDATSGVNILRNYDLRFPDFLFWGSVGATIDVDVEDLPTEFYKTGFNILADEYGFNYPILDENGNEIVM